MQKYMFDMLAELAVMAAECGDRWLADALEKVVNRQRDLGSCEGDTQRPRARLNS